MSITFSDISNKISQIFYAKGYAKLAVFASRFKCVVTDSLTTPYKIEGNIVYLNTLLSPKEAVLCAKKALLSLILHHPQDIRKGDHAPKEIELSNFFDQDDYEVISIPSCLSFSENTVRHIEKYAGWSWEKIWEDMQNGQDKNEKDGGKGSDESDKNESLQQEYEDVKDELKSAILDEYNSHIIIKKQLYGRTEVDPILPLHFYYKDQLRLEKGRSYKRPNKKYIDEEFVFKGNVRIKKPSKTITVFCDTSGSFDAAKINKSLGILSRIKAINGITFDVIYFSDDLSRTANFGGGTNYGEVINYLENNKHVRDVVIITDDDFFSRRDTDIQLDAMTYVLVHSSSTNFYVPAKKELRIYI